MRNNRRNRGLELGVLLLVSELFNTGFGVIPPVTLGTIIGQTLLYLGIIQVPWDRWDVCISAQNVWRNQDWKRLILSAVEHGDDRHLYYNMISFLSKARSLEPRYGSLNFAILLTIITTLTSGIYVALGLSCANVLHDAYYLQTCAIGFSGVVFALKVITTMENNYYTQTTIAGFTMPSKYAPWAELILIHLLVPNASFMGHLAGILAGLMYTSTPIGSIIDSIIRTITGRGMWHEWTARSYYRRY